MMHCSWRIFSFKNRQYTKFRGLRFHHESICCTDTSVTTNRAGTPEDWYWTKFLEGSSLTEFSDTMVLGIQLGADGCPYPSTWFLALWLSWETLLVRWHSITFCVYLQIFNIDLEGLIGVHRARILPICQRKRTPVATIHDNMFSLSLIWGHIFARCPTSCQK